MSNCEVCNDSNLMQEATCDERSFRWAVVKSLCFIAKQLGILTEEEVVLPETVILPQVVKTFTEIEAGYATYNTVGLIDSTKKLEYLRIVNTLNVAIDVSVDGGSNTLATIPAGATYERNFNLILSATTSLKVKKVSGTVSSGSLYIEGSYQS